MFAAQITDPGRIDLIEVEEPKLTDQPGEVLFQPECACLCGSDVPFFLKNGEQGYPVVGHSLHEMVGSVIDTNGSKFQPGDRVLAVPVYQVGFFERYVLSEQRVIPLAPGIPEEIAMMAQPLGTVLYALRKLPNLLGKTVAVFGQGPMGQLYDMTLRNLGAAKVIGIDPLEERLELSRKSGATHVFCNQNESPVEYIKEVNGGELADLVIEVVGHREQAFNDCIEAAAYGSDLLYFGVPPETIDNIQWRSLFRKNIQVYTSVEPDFDVDFPLAMQWIADGIVDVSHLLTHRFPLSEIQSAYELFSQRADGACKVILEFPSWAHKTL